MMRTAVAIASSCLLAACSSAGSSETATTADITKISQVKSSFGQGFKVRDIPKTGIDPKVLSPHKLPEGMKFDPSDCAKFVVGQDVPPGLQGNMAAVSAEGNGNRFIAIALQTSKPVPFNDPGRNCNKVGFEGGPVRGALEVVDAPQIDGTRTLGVHRVIQATVGSDSRTGQLYNYSAHFGDYQVIVTANPLVVPGKPVTPVDTNRARDLLVKSVAAVRS
jgi:Domain of unknown function (DUF5642)